MAALADKQPMKVAMIVNSSADEGNTCLTVRGNTIDIARPGSAAKAKSLGPFTAVVDSAASLFDTAPTVTSSIALGMLLFRYLAHAALLLIPCTHAARRFLRLV